MQRHDYDSPWKEMLSEYFQEFMTFFFPDASQDIDWTRRYELLDKELRQITREADIGVRLADHLVKVWQKNGEETWVLNHVEIQAPFHDKMKDEIISFLHDIRAPLDLTSSCYNVKDWKNDEKPIHCGRCESCFRRKRAFSKAEIDDLTLYE